MSSSLRLAPRGRGVVARTIIASVGTGLLTNHGWKREEPTPHEDWLLDQLRNWANQALLKRLRPGDPYEVVASPETHTLYRLEQQQRLQPGDSIYWLSSDTEAGKLCAYVLQMYYDRVRQPPFHSEVRVVKDLNHREGCFESGLKNLAIEALHIAKYGEGIENTIICGTGGFKPEVAYLSLVGILLEVEVCYLYENTTCLVTLPRPPIEGWDQDKLASYLQRLGTTR